MMTDQEVFDKVARHLLIQGRKSLGMGGYCAYRGEGGTMCAIGCLIPDEDYVPEMEGKSISELADRDTHNTTCYLAQYTTLANAVGKISDNIQLLDDLQKVHDIYPVSEWKECLDSIADHRNLSKNVLNEF